MSSGVAESKSWNKACIDTSDTFAALKFHCMMKSAFTTSQFSRGFVKKEFLCPRLGVLSAFIAKVMNRCGAVVPYNFNVSCLVCVGDKTREITRAETKNSGKNISILLGNSS
eukprot:PhF_6_TR474/c0_g1_i1/m.217